MHEHSFIKAIISNIENKDSVKSISLEVGELEGIEAEHLKEHLIEQTGWDVEVKKKLSIVKCDCGFEGRARICERLHELVIFECPKCGNVPEIKEGKDIKIVKIVYN